MKNQTVNSAFGLRVKAYAGTMKKTSRRTRWIISACAKKSVDELNFTERVEDGSIRWWQVNPPKTNYWHVHQMLGRAYAFEVLDLVNNPAAQEESRHCLRFILGAIADWLPSVRGTAATGMADGFFEVIDEYVSTGTADR